MLANHSLENYQTHRRELIFHRRLIMDKIRCLDNQFDNAEFTQHLRNLWIIDGFVKHDFQLTVLMNIA